MTKPWPDKREFTSKTFTVDREEHYHMLIKGLIGQEERTNINVYTPNDRQ